MTIDDFITKLKQTPQEISFQDTMAVLEANYHFNPTSFTNGALINGEGENSGSCKLFSFARLQKFNEEETLHCFGNYYLDVLNNTKGNNHQNIRNFIKTGWNGITFKKEALAPINV